MKTRFGEAFQPSNHTAGMCHARSGRFLQKTLRLEDRYPGINGIGVIHFLKKDAQEEYLIRRRLERPGFKMFPAHDQNILMPISFIEPEADNAAALGLDVAHEVNRRTAAIASRDTGTAQITGPIVLVQDATSTPGFLFYAPFYDGIQPTSLQLRQTSALGAVYAPFVMSKLMEGLLSRDQRDVRLSITDQNEALYDEHATPDSTTDPAPLYTKQVTIDIYGRQWVLDVRSDLIFRQQNSFAQPTFILICGLLIEVLIITLMVLMSRANSLAVSYANKVTVKLKQQARELEKTNHELEQFAYVTSHDLKTPIRGISGLTEMIREDLDPYFASSDCNPDVSENLNRIMDRVGRMSALTHGIMELSRVGADTVVQPPLRLSEAVESMEFDFALKPGQLSLSSAVDVIHADPSGLRRILENLVGNAVKHHAGTNPLQIGITITQINDRYHLSVTDNGPGIDPRYHSKVFDVFQTLRLNGAPESTGIGLAIVKKTVERHGGQIRLHSTKDQGAVFEFDWPVTPPGVQAKTYEKAA